MNSQARWGDTQLRYPLLLLTPPVSWPRLLIDSPGAALVSSEKREEGIHESGGNKIK